jgi:CRISPR-associated protein Cmr2
MTDWTLKRIALLHDPPGKTLGLAEHQRRAFELIERFIGIKEFHRRFGKAASELTRRDFENTSEGKLIKEADRIASAIDRAGFPNEVRLESAGFIRNPQIRHPFCGKPLELSLGSGDPVENILNEEILNLVSNQPDPRKKYLALWRMLPLLASDTSTRLLPPDTRILDHTLWAHLDVSSGLVSALPQAAILQVAIGPVQSFIYEARRTQDLWMGSCLLSFLVWAGIKSIAERYGPDAVLYPALRGHPIADEWLKGELDALSPLISPNDITIAATPNKFVAVVPAGEVQNLAEEVTRAVRDTWHEIADEVRKDFPGGPQNATWQEIWDRQVQREDWPEIYWSAVLWPDIDSYRFDAGAEEALERVENCLGAQDLYRDRLELYRRSWQKGTNVGSMYDALYDLLSGTMDARKHSRNFDGAGEDGEKCTVSPSLSALRTQDKQSRRELRRYWQSVAASLKGNGRAHELRADGRERLSAVAAVKRFARQSYFARRNITLAFPSTSRVAAVPFYRELFKRLTENSHLQQALQKHLSALEQLEYPRVSSQAAEGALPGLREEMALLPEGFQTDAKKILRYDADILYPERLAPRLLERDLGLTDRQAAEEAQKTCRKLRKAAEMAPPTYYAILLMDGDDMGEWLAGKHEQMPSFREVMHPDVLPKFPDLPNATDWENMLNASRPLAANVHASLSTALSNFARRCVRWVVEQRHFGRVIYAGGDDVLAFLPLTEALSAAYELYRLFTGYARVQNGNPQIKTESNGFVEWDDDILLMPGPRITLSAGIAIAHHLYPLDAALQAAWAAEKSAKEVRGKASVVVQVIKRSGATVRMRSKWDSLGGLFDDLVEYFAEKRLSSRFAYDLSSRAHIVTALPAEARKATLKQLVGRHKTNALADARADELIDRLATWAQELDSQTPPEKMDNADVPQGLAEVARWVVLARFVAQGGGE